MDSAVAIPFDRVREWLFATALPFWASEGVDRKDGGFVEHLDLHGRDGGAGFKRVRAQARQVYCFSHAALLDPGGPWAEVSDFGWRFLVAHGRLGDGGWARRLDRRGGVLDPTPDAYDLAFVLFAHAWRFRLTGEAALLESAHRTLDALDVSLRHLSGLGWSAEQGDHGLRQQNPHMHLLEAAVELAQATGEDRFATMAREIASLFRDRLMERGTGVLPEFFEADWSPSSTPQGRLVEPGHQMEWSWLLYRAEPVLGFSMREEARLLQAWAEAHGVRSDTGLVIDSVRDDGVVLSSDSRLWPQTEALKARLARFEHEGVDTRAGIAKAASNLLDRYLAHQPSGSWIDHFDHQGRPRVDKIPSTSFYHLFLAFSELLRLQPKLEAPAGV